MKKTVTVRGRTWEFERGRVSPRWRFGAGQTPTEEQAEIAAAQLAGESEAYMRGQEQARQIEAETERRRAQHPERQRRRRRRARRRRAAVRATSEAALAGRLPAPREVEAARTKKGGWTRATLASWGVPWPPPKGWRATLEKMRRGEAERPCGWSGPVEISFERADGSGGIRPPRRSSVSG